MTDWSDPLEAQDPARAHLLGRRVAIQLTNGDPSELPVGVLLHVDLYGEARIRADDGQTCYCWPALEIYVVEPAS